MRKALAFIFISTLIFGCNTEEDAGPAESSTFIKFFGGSNSDMASAAFETSDGGFIVLGTTSTENDDGSSSFQIRLIKTDQSGNMVWDKQFPENTEDGLSYTGNSLIVKEEGYLIIGDRIYANGETGLLLLEVNLSGEEVMNNDITITEAEDTISIHGIDLIENDDTELKVTGKIESPSQNMYVGTVSTSDFSVMPSCTFRYSSSAVNPNLIKSICVENNGDVVFGASVNNNSRLIRVPNCQNSQITGPLLETSGSSVYNAAQVVKGVSGYAMIGTTNANVNTDIFFARTNSLGDSPQIKIYTEIDGITLSNDETAFTISPTEDGGFIFGGSTLSSTEGELDMIIAKIGFTGNIEWSQRFGDQNEESVRFISQTSDGGFLILGNTEFGGIDTITLIKIDNKGQIN